MALIGEMQYLTIGGNTYSLPSGGGGSVSSVAVSNATNGGLSVSGSPISSRGTITVGHSNVLSSAQTTQAVYPIKIDKNGHISAYGTAVTISDTKNTAGSTDSNSKLFLIGATSQAANPQTYSHDTAYVGTDGYLYSNSKKTLVEQYSNNGYNLKITPSVSNSYADFRIQAALDDTGNFYETLYFGSDGFSISNDIDEKSWININENSDPPVNITGVRTPTEQYDAANKKYVDDSINALDGSITGTAGAGKTLTAFSQTNGKVTATFGNISITKSQISDFPTIPDVSGKIDTAGTGLSKSGTTLNHSNSVTAQTTQAVYPIKIDAQGHISAYGSAVTIPTVNNATLTIQKNGSTVNTFTANASSNVTANITVPTKTSDLTNDNSVKSVTESPSTALDGTIAVTTGGENGISITSYVPVKGVALQSNIPTTAGSNTTGISVSDHSTSSIYGVQSSTTTASKVTLGTALSVTGVSGSTTASKVTVGSHSTDYGVTAAGSGSFTSGAFSGGSGSFSATVTDHVLSFSHSHTAATHGADSHSHTAPTLGSKVPTVSASDVTVPKAAASATSIPNVTAATDVTVPIKNSSSTTVVTGKSHTITDNGHTHTLS